MSKRRQSPSPPKKRVLRSSSKEAVKKQKPKRKASKTPPVARKKITKDSSNQNSSLTEQTEQSIIREDITTQSIAVAGPNDNFPGDSTEKPSSNDVECPETTTFNASRESDILAQTKIVCSRETLTVTEEADATENTLSELLTSVRSDTIETKKLPKKKAIVIEKPNDDTATHLLNLFGLEIQSTSGQSTPIQSTEEPSNYFDQYMSRMMEFGQRRQEHQRNLRETMTSLPEQTLGVVTTNDLPQRDTTETSDAYANENVPIMSLIDKTMAIVPTEQTPTVIPTIDLPQRDITETSDVSTNPSIQIEPLVAVTSQPITDSILGALNLFGFQPDPNFNTSTDQPQTTSNITNPILSHLTSTMGTGSIANSQNPLQRSKSGKTVGPQPKSKRTLLELLTQTQATTLTGQYLVDSSDDSDNDDEIIINERIENDRQLAEGENAVELPVINATWALEKIFPNVQECQKFIDSEATWRKGNNRKQKKGVKQEYLCSKVKHRGPQCAAGIYTLSNCEPNDPQLYMYRKNLAHNHDDLPNQIFKLSEETKKIIIDLHDKKETFKGILFKLGQMELDYLPRHTQIRSVITDYQRKKFGSTKAEISGFVDFYEANNAIPVDQDTAFVADFQHSEPGANDKWIRMFVSTTRLLKMAENAECLHADGTYRLNTLNYPLIVVGVTDKARCFHLIGLALMKHEAKEDYAFAFGAMKKAMIKIVGRSILPRALISDAAPAIFNGYEMVFDHPTARIMCWFHVKYNVGKYKFTSQENRKLANQDLNKMHNLFDEVIFDAAAKLFVEKWKTNEVEFIQKFENSFIKQNKYWFFGARDKTPVHNNALESFNGSVKIHQTHWERKPISEFKFRMLEIVSERSKEYHAYKDSFENEVPVSREMQTKGYEYSVSEKQFIMKKHCDDCKFYVFANANEHFKITEKDVDEFLNIDWKAFKQFDELIEGAVSMYCVSFDIASNNWRDSKCTCPSYGKLFVCKHILALCYRFDILERPTFIIEYLHANPRRGPRVKAKKGLVRQ